MVKPDLKRVSVVKAKIRKYIWRLLEEKGAARFPRPIYGRIPNFVGAEKAAERLRNLKVYEKAEVIFCNPDSPQRRVREMVLLDGKTLVMASPRLRRGFILLDPSFIPRNAYRLASTIRGALSLGKEVHPSKLEIDLKVTGSVAVTVKGARLGKGGGYSDLEYAILREYRALNQETPVVTTVHELQIVDEIPMTPHDVPVDVVITPLRVIETRTPYLKPTGIDWSILTEDKIRGIPLLNELKLKKAKRDGVS